MQKEERARLELQLTTKKLVKYVTSLYNLIQCIFLLSSTVPSVELVLAINSIGPFQLSTQNSVEKKIKTLAIPEVI